MFFVYFSGVIRSMPLLINLVRSSQVQLQINYTGCSWCVFACVTSSSPSPPLSTQRKVGFGCELCNEVLYAGSDSTSWHLLYSTHAHWFANAAQEPVKNAPAALASASSSSLPERCGRTQQLCRHFAATPSRQVSLQQDSLSGNLGSALLVYQGCSCWEKCATDFHRQKH